MTRVLVAGAAGFIGRHMIARLLAETDWEIIGAARSSPEDVPTDGRLSWVYGDLASGQSGRWARMVGEVDYIVNLAADAQAGASLAHPALVVENNVGLMLTLLEFARRQVGLRRFVQVSSAEVFGTSCVFHAEDDPARPESPYAASKAAQDALALAYREAYGVPVLVSHTSNVFGEGQSEGKLLPALVRQVAAGRVALEVIAGDRTFIHVEDCASAWLWLLEHADEGWTHCNVAGQLRLSHAGFARLVARAAGMPEVVVNVGGEGRHGQRGDVLLDGSRLAQAGWRHPVGLLAGVGRAVGALMVSAR